MAYDAGSDDGKRDPLMDATIHTFDVEHPFFVSNKKKFVECYTTKLRYVIY